MKIADDNKCLDIFLGASNGWFKSNPGKSFQDLEKELRQRNFNTHVIAIKPREFPGVTLKHVHDVFHQGTGSEKPLWEAIISCRPREKALEELLTHSSSYKENFEKLPLAGMFSVKNEERIKEDDLKDQFKTFSLTEQNFLKRLSDNLAIVEYHPITLQEFINMLKDVTKCENIQTTLVGMTNNGEPIFAFVNPATNDVLSSIGVCIDGTQKTKSFDLESLGDFK